MARKVPQPHGGSITLIEKGDKSNGGRPPLLLSTIVKELRANGNEQATTAATMIGGAGLIVGVSLNISAGGHQRKAAKAFRP